MDSVARFGAGLVGLAIIGCIAHAAVAAGGGHGAHGAPLLMALACGLAVGSVAVGVAWRERRWLIAILIGAGLVAGEGYALLLTSERTLEAREQKQAPIRAALAAGSKALERVAAAERALDNASTSPRLERALAAKATADVAVVAKAAERDCAVNCRALLEQQVAAAAAEVAAARADLSVLRGAAEAEFEAAWARLAALPAPASASPLADRLGIDGWQVDLAAAVLASLAANGLGAFLLAFAAHGRSSRSSDSFEPAARRSAAAEADAFAREVFRPQPGGRIAIADIKDAYQAWCRGRGLDPLPNQEFGRELAALFASVGLYRVGVGAAAEIPGLEWVTPDALRHPAGSRPGGVSRSERVKAQASLAHEAEWRSPA